MLGRNWQETKQAKILEEGHLEELGLLLASHSGLCSYSAYTFEAFKDKIPYRKQVKIQFRDKYTQMKREQSYWSKLNQGIKKLRRLSERYSVTQFFGRQLSSVGKYRKMEDDGKIK